MERLYAIALMGENDCIIELVWAVEKDEALVKAHKLHPEREQVAIKLVAD